MRSDRQKSLCLCTTSWWHGSDAVLPHTLRRLPRERSIPGSKAMAGSIATGVLGQVVLVASGIVVARALGPESRGVLALVFLLGAIVTQLAAWACLLQSRTRSPRKV